MKHYDILTIFPEVCTPYAAASILGRAQKEKRLRIRVHQLRKWSPDKKHRKVDDKPFGGGPGMVMQVEPFDKGVAAVRRKVGRVHVVLTSASGKRFTEADAKRLAAYDQVIFLCGRYEGVDHRVEEHVAHESLSIGDYVLTGGELPALVMVDAVARLIPGVLGKESSLDMESHATPGVLEYPQYTRPEAYKMRGKTGDGKWKLRQIKVPAVLLSGHHEKIAAWRQKQTKGHTRNT